MDKRHVVIIGGGITGISAAYRLAKLGVGTDVEYTLFESDRRLGGKIHTLETEDYRLELGPDSIYTRKAGALELIAELGLNEDIVPVSPSGGTLIWHREDLRPLPPGFHSGVPSDLTSFRKTDLLTPAGKMRALEDILLPYYPYEGDISLGHLLRERLGDEIVDVVATPLLAGIHAGDIDQMSTEANMPVLLQWYREHQSLIVGALKAQSRAMPHASVETKLETKPEPMFISLKHGLTQLVDELSQRVQGLVNVELSARVVNLKRLPNCRYELTVEQNSTTYTVVADGVIITTPANVAGKLLSQIDLNGKLLKDIRYASTATVSFGYDEAPVTLKTSGFLVPRTEGATITACTIVSNKWTHSSKTGKFLVRCYVGHDGSEAFTSLDDEALISLVNKDLEKILGYNQKADFTVVKRWNSAMPQYDVGHLSRIEAFETELATVPGIVVAGSSYRGVGIPDCITDGARAAKTLARYLNRQQQ